MEPQGDKVTNVIVQKETNGSAVTSLVLGIIGVVVGFLPYIGWFMAPVWLLAIIFGIIGIRKPYKRGMSITGLILGILGAAYKIGFWLVVVGGLFAASTSTSTSTGGDISTSVQEAPSASEQEAEFVVVPDLNGEMIDYAKQQIERSGLIVGEIVEIEDVETQKGLVIKTEPEASQDVGVGTEVNIFQSSGKPAQNLTLIDFKTNEEIELIQGRKEQVFLFIYFFYSEGSTEVLDAISANIAKFTDAGIEVGGIISEETSFKERELIESENWEFPIYLDKDAVYHESHDIFFTPDISVEFGTGEKITDSLSGEDFFFESVSADDVVNEILDKAELKK